MLATSAPVQHGNSRVVTVCVRAYGIVQGVGFRPTVSRHATTAHITGSVCNKGPYVEIYAQGSQIQVDTFVRLLKEQPPRRSSIIKLDVHPVQEAPLFSTFDIIESERTKGEIFISPDLAICEDCKRELFDPSDRRYLHPFINCTNCGPRLTILDALPYDRVRTSMGEFPLCPTCNSEYHNPASRRFDAQPVCCNDCGPEVYLLDRCERGREAITAARSLIAQGSIVAIKGIGGFHLCCDATNAAAVQLLRDRKRRSAKPFAVMARDLEVAERECELSSTARELLDGHQKPIVLVNRRASGTVAAEVAPDNPKLGVMLPYAPLQLLLFTYDDGIEMPDILVMTSANESGAPICRDDEDARRELAPLADAILSHNRLIRVRADDTVVDLYHDQPYMVRRSRGWAPLPLMVGDAPGPRVLAIGGELKGAFCIGTGELFYPSPYVGDLADVRTVDALRETVHRMLTLLETTPEVIACDLHPRYNSTVVAEELAGELDVDLVRVQHHYAHVLSCMAENDISAPVIGVSFDGTGYGSDGTIWGGEILLSTWDGFERLGHIASFAQAGGDLSAREGWRVALALLIAHEGHERAFEIAQELGLCSQDEAQVVASMIETGVNSITSTSAGRLFDAVSAVLGIRRVNSFEGEAATQLQFAAERVPVGECPECFFAPGDVLLREAGEDAGAATPGVGESSSDGGFVLATDELFARLVERRLAGEQPEHLAYDFHLGLSELVEAACLRVREERGLETVALTGGCFQNTLLLDLCERRLRDQGFAVLTHGQVPPNDGGIALGQAVVAARQLAKSREG